MPRLHLKPCVAVTTSFLVLALLVASVVHYRRSRPYYRGVSDVDPKLWKLLSPLEETTVKATPQPVPKIHLKQLPPLSLDIHWSTEQIEDIFFRYLENKDVRCERDFRLGNWNDGGWNVCMSPPFKLEQPCVVFSFGIGNDWQFDDTVANNYGCRVFAYDPSMKEPVAKRSFLIEFRRIGLGASSGLGRNGWKLKTLRQHFQDEGLWAVPVDYVKIDVEYMEWEILKQTLTDGSLKLVKQLGFEIHTPHFLQHDEAENKTVKCGAGTDRLTFIHMFETLHQIEISGFKKFNYRKNPFGNYISPYTGKERSCCYELHYINTEFLLQNNTVTHFNDSQLFHR